MIHENAYRVLIDDLSPAQIERIERRMRPDSHDDPHFEGSVSGFLAPDEHLRDVIAADLQTLDALGLKPEDIADRLEEIIGRAVSILDQNPEPLSSRVRVSRRWMLTGYDRIVMGYQQCPFEDAEGTLCDWYSLPSGWRFGGQDLCITHLASGMALAVPRLAIHLIRAHHFFEGHVPYRVDPQRAAEILELSATR